MVIGVPHATKRVLHLDFTNCLAGMALDFFEKLALCWYGFFKGGFEVWFGGGGVGSYRVGDGR